MFFHFNKDMRVELPLPYQRFLHIVPLFRRFNCYATLQQCQVFTWKVLWNTPDFWRAKQMMISFF